MLSQQLIETEASEAAGIAFYLSTTMSQAAITLGLCVPKLSAAVGHACAGMKVQVLIAGAWPP